MRTKAAGDVYEWTEDYSAELNASDPADTITTSEWAATNGLVIDSDSHANGKTTAWISGGTDYTYATVTNTITTDQGRTYVKTLEFDVRPQTGCD